MLRNLSVASGALIALAVAAAPAMAQQAGSWTGPYAGLNLGYGGGSFHYPYSGTTDAAGTSPTSGSVRQDSSGVLGGVTLGYNYEMPNGLLLGFETDIDASDISGNAGYYNLNSAGGVSNAQVDTRIDYLGTARVRIGKALFNNRFVPYVTGGFAYGGVRSESAANCAACGAGGTAASFGYVSPSQTQTGWTVGGGAEYALTSHLSVKAEYLYVDLGQVNLNYGGSTFAGPGYTVYNANIDEKADANIVRVGFNWKF